MLTHRKKHPPDGRHCCGARYGKRQQDLVDLDWVKKRSLARGAWRVARGAWRVARGAWRVARGAWRVARGAWRAARGAWEQGDGK